MSHDHPGNIMLDFLDRDGREIWGVFEDFTEKAHRTALIAALNCASFLCYDFCVLPPVFVTVDPLVREVLRRKARYLEARLIRLPLREQSLTVWIDKARQQYTGQADWYDQITRPDAFDFLSKYASAVIGREGDVGSTLASRWESGPDVSLYWAPMRENLEHSLLEKARIVPTSLVDEGSAVTWSAIESRLPPASPKDKLALRRMLQHEYFRIYSNEYDLSVLYNLPFARMDFAGGNRDPYYDYELFINLARAGGISSLLARLSAQSIIDIRSTIGHHRLQSAHWALTRITTDTHAIFEAYAKPIAARDVAFERELLRISAKAEGFSGVILDQGELEIVEERLLELAASAASASDKLLEREQQEEKNSHFKMGRQYARIAEKEGKSMPSVLVFVALREELDVLIARWKLTNEFRDRGWKGNIDSLPVTVICAHGAGRVRAAIEAASYLTGSEARPDLIIVTGIAGGFKETDGTTPGDVIVASNVADLGTRKMRDGADGDVPELRIEPYECDGNVLEVVRSGSFREREWANMAAELFDYPRGVLPRVLSGTLICSDEIVSSDEWRLRLLRAWPKSYGVEMESGGVMAAARKFGGIPVAVVRGVSDNANPLKADNEWRVRAARSAALLVEEVLKVIWN